MQSRSLASDVVPGGGTVGRSAAGRTGMQMPTRQETRYLLPIRSSAGVAGVWGSMGEAGFLDTSDSAVGRRVLSMRVSAQPWAVSVPVPAVGLAVAAVAAAAVVAGLGQAWPVEGDEQLALHPGRQAWTWAPLIPMVEWRH